MGGANRLWEELACCGRSFHQHSGMYSVGRLSLRSPAGWEEISRIRPLGTAEKLSVSHRKIQPCCGDVLARKCTRIRIQDNVEQFKEQREKPKTLEEPSGRHNLPINMIMNPPKRPDRGGGGQC